MSSLSLSEQLLLNPGLVLGDLDVDAGNITLSTSNTPRNNAGKLPQPVDLTDEWSTTVTGAGISALLSTGTEESGVEVEVWTKSRLPEHGLTLLIVDDRDFDFFEYLLVRSLRESILAPSSGLTTMSGEVKQPVWQADGADVRVLCVVNEPADPDKSNVVVQVSGVVLLVDEDADDVHLDMGVELGVVVHVPFADTNSNQNEKLFQY